MLTPGGSFAPGGDNMTFKEFEVVLTALNFYPELAPVKIEFIL